MKISLRLRKAPIPRGARCRAPDATARGGAVTTRAAARVLSARMRARARQARRECSSVSFKELLESWRKQAAAPRTAKAYAVRLPVDDAARLAALAEVFPRRAPEPLPTPLLGAGP